MKAVFALGGLVCVLGMASAAAAGPEVPFPLRGVWNDAGTCAAGGGDGSLVIEANRIAFRGASSAIEAVTVKGPREAVIASKVTDGEETWTDITTFRVSADGQTLTDASDPNEPRPHVRVRCGG